MFSLYHGEEETGDHAVTRGTRSSAEISEDPNARNEGRPEAKPCETAMQPGKLSH